MNANTEVTGRDGYIICQSLIYAIARIQSLPPEKQELSNMADMCAITRVHAATTAGIIAAGVYQHTGVLVDLWPDRDEATDPVWKAMFDKTVKSMINLGTRADGHE